jgi:hypothetical protein
MPQPQDNLLALTSILAVGSGSIAAYLADIPNQPLRFWVRFISNFILI